MSSLVDHLDGEEVAGCFAVLWTVIWVMSVMISLRVLLVPLVGYEL